MVNLVEVLRAHKVMGIVRGSSGEAAEAAALALFDAGVGLVEVSLTTPDAVRVIARWLPRRPRDASSGPGRSSRTRRRAPRTSQPCASRCLT